MPALRVDRPQSNQRRIFVSCYYKECLAIFAYFCFVTREFFWSLQLNYLLKILDLPYLFVYRMQYLFCKRCSNFYLNAMVKYQ